MKDFLRAALAVIAGFLLTAILVMVLFLVAFLILGPDRAYEPGTFVAAPLWIGVAALFTLIAGLAGGAVCGLIARSKVPAFVLCALFVLGSAPNFFKPLDPPGVHRSPDLSTREVLEQAMEVGYEPLISRIAHPVGGVIGVLLGSAVAQRRRAKNA